MNNQICKFCKHYEPEHYFTDDPAKHYGQCPYKKGKVIQEKESCGAYKQNKNE